MAIFEDKELKRKVQYLEDERTKIWNRIVLLENENKKLKTQIIGNASESAKDAAQSSRRAAEFRNKSEQRLNEANEKVGEINAKLQEAHKFLGDITNAKDNVIEIKVKAEQIDEDYKNQYNLIKERIDNLEEFLKEYPELDDKLEEIQDFIDEIDSNVNKSKLGLSTINLKRKEIEEFYQEVFGYFTKDDDNEEIRVDGIKQHLEDGFSELSDNIKKSEDRISKVRSEYETQFKDFEQSHRSRYEHINEEISSLLPAALTAGLSSAFSSKKEQEENNSLILQNRFQIGIYMLIGASFIPFIVSVFLLNKGETFDQIVYKIPRLVLAIIPMYVPILWFTYSANKKLNLSKRLIEEYAHKEVLSKTYEGLSKQINNLDSDEQTNELNIDFFLAFYKLLRKILVN